MICTVSTFVECGFPEERSIQYCNSGPVDQGPVVQSIVSLTTSSRRQLVKYMSTTLLNTPLFFVGKM